VLGLLTSLGCWQTCTTGFVVLAATDVLDGYFARRFQAESTWGATFDPVADKVLIGSVGIGLFLNGSISPLVCCAVVARDSMLITGALALRFWALNQSEDDFSTLSKKFFDSSVQTHRVVPSLLSKINTGAQCVWITSALGAQGFPGLIGEQVPESLGTLVLATTLVSGMDYLRLKGIQRI